MSFDINSTPRVEGGGGESWSGWARGGREALAAVREPQLGERAAGAGDGGRHSLATGRLRTGKYSGLGGRRHGVGGGGGAMTAAPPSPARAPSTADRPPASRARHAGAAYASVDTGGGPAPPPRPYWRLDGERGAGRVCWKVPRGLVGTSRGRRAGRRGSWCVGGGGLRTGRKRGRPLRGDVASRSPPSGRGIAAARPPPLARRIASGVAVQEAAAGACSLEHTSWTAHPRARSDGRASSAGAACRL